MECGIIIFLVICFFEGWDGSIWMVAWGQERGDNYFFGNLFSYLISVFVLGGENVWVGAWG